MALSRTSVLHYWSARYGPLPVIGGKPVHSRNSAGSVADERGELYDAIINTPRFAWETDRSSIANERRAMLLLEFGSQNKLPFGATFSDASWIKSNLSVAAGVPDPKGGTGAYTLTATGANATIDQTLSAGASLVRANGAWVRRRAGSGLVKIVRPDGAAYDTIAIGSTWQPFSAIGAASTVRESGFNVVTNGDAIDAYGFQLEEASVASSDMLNLTASLTTRAADSFYWQFPPAPQAMMLYTRFVEGGTCRLGGGLWSIVNAAGTGTPNLVVFGGGATAYILQHTVGSSVTSQPTGVPAVGDTVELLAIFFVDGRVQLIQSINGAAVTSGGVSAALTPGAAWSDRRLWANSQGSLSVGRNKFAELKVVLSGDVVALTDQARMDELRAFELGPNGEVL